MFVNLTKSHSNPDIDLRVEALRGFKRYGNTPRDAIRKPVFNENKVIDQFRIAWRKFDCRDLPKDCYWKVLTAVRNITYTSEDVKMFCALLPEFQEGKNFSVKAGVFLSALINNGEDKKYRILTKHLSIPIHYLGYLNSKNIFIDGSAGNFLGYHMNGGAIRANGSAGHSVGCRMNNGLIEAGRVGDHTAWEMRNGIILVREDGGNYLGMFQEGGMVVVGKNVGHNLGRFMYGGTVIVMGNSNKGVGSSETAAKIKTDFGGNIRIFGDCSDMCEVGCGTKIYHKNIRIRPTPVTLLKTIFTKLKILRGYPYASPNSKLTWKGIVNDLKFIVEEEIDNILQ